MTCSDCRAGGGREGHKKYQIGFWRLKRPFSQFFRTSHILLSFIYFFRGLKSFTRFDKNQNRRDPGNLLGLSKGRMCMSWDESKFSYAQIEERECWRCKITKIFSFLTNRYRIETFSTYPKISFPSYLRENMWKFPTLFGFKKGFFFANLCYKSRQ